MQTTPAKIRLLDLVTDRSAFKEAAKALYVYGFVDVIEGPQPEKPGYLSLKFPKGTPQESIVKLFQQKKVLDVLILPPFKPGWSPTYEVQESAASASGSQGGTSASPVAKRRGSDQPDAYTIERLYETASRLWTSFFMHRAAVAEKEGKPLTRSAIKSIEGNIRSSVAEMAWALYGFEFDNITRGDASAVTPPTAPQQQKPQVQTTHTPPPAPEYTQPQEEPDDLPF